jgi:hypothetical protein
VIITLAPGPSTSPTVPAPAVAGVEDGQVLPRHAPVLLDLARAVQAVRARGERELRFGHLGREPPGVVGGPEQGTKVLALEDGATVVTEPGRRVKEPAAVNFMKLFRPRLRKKT